MTQYEMTEKLSEKANVTLEEAKAALESGNWNMLTATHLLEQEKFRRMQALNEFAMGGEAVAVQAAPEAREADGIEVASDEPATPEAVEEPKAEKRRDKAHRSLGNHIRRLVACGNRNRFEVRKGEASVLAMPVTALVLLLLFAFWVCVPLLVIGLFAGFRYSFSGRELGRKDVNRALAKAADAADRMKETVASA